MIRERAVKWESFALLGASAAIPRTQPSVRTDVHRTLPVAVDAAHQLGGLLARSSQQLQHNGGPGWSSGSRRARKRWPARDYVTGQLQGPTNTLRPATPCPACALTCCPLPRP